MATNRCPARVELKLTHYPLGETGERPSVACPEHDRAPCDAVNEHGLMWRLTNVALFVLALVAALAAMYGVLPDVLSRRCVFLDRGSRRAAAADSGRLPAWVTAIALRRRLAAARLQPRRAARRLDRLVALRGLAAQLNHADSSCSASGIT
jgi:hypothetical protein